MRKYENTNSKNYFFSTYKIISLCLFLFIGLRLFLSKHFIRSKKYRHTIKALAQFKFLKCNTQNITNRTNNKMIVTYFELMASPGNTSPLEWEALFVINISISLGLKQ